MRALRLLERCFAVVLGLMLIGNLAAVYLLSSSSSSSNQEDNASLEAVQSRAVASSAPPPKPIIRYRKISPFGRSCNRLITLASALERAEREDFILQIYARDWQTVFRRLDMELFNRTFSHRLQYLGRNPGYTNNTDESWLVSTSEYWCGLRVPLQSMRDGFRPALVYRQAAEEKMALMRKTEAGVMSIHLRHYDGFCGQPLPTGCEATSQYEFLPQPFGCNQTLTKEYWQWVNSNWKDNAQHRKMKTAVYLSTDRQVKSIDDSYLLRTTEELERDYGITRVYQPGAEDFRRGKQEKNEYLQTSEMFEDMWISVLSDRHVGMPLSSCDKIVAEWRAAVVRHREGTTTSQEDAVHPRQCYGKYFNPTTTLEQDDAHGFCHHTQSIGLDSGNELFVESACQVCKTVLAMYVALAKASNTNNGKMMDLHLYGPFAAFARDTLAMHSAGVFVDYLPRTKDSMLFGRRQAYASNKFRSSGVKTQSQYDCVVGRTVRKVILPNEQVRKEAEQEEEDTSLELTCLNHGEEESVCAHQSDRRRPQSRHQRRHQSAAAVAVDPTRVIKQLWRMAVAKEVHADEHSPCSQLVALWRREIGNLHGMHPEACFYGYFAAAKEDDDPVLYSHNEAMVWACP